MQKLKRVGATLVGSLMASSTLLAGALAADLSAFKNMTTADTVVVVGANAATADVVGGINIAAALARNGASATTTGGAVTEVSGGVALETDTTKLYLGSSTDTAKQALTASDLPNLLASGTVVDDTGEEYAYDQYLYVGSNTINFGKPNDLEDPVVYVDLSSTIYTLKVVFNDEIAFNNTDVQGNSITLFGKEFTIGQGSTNQDIILYEAAEEVTVTAGEETTVTIDGETYTIGVVGISSDGNTATITINGKSYTKTEGADITIGNTVFQIKEVNLYEVPEKTGNVVITLGSKKIEIKGSAVYVEDQQVDGVTATITEGDKGVSTIELQVSQPDTDNAYITADHPFTDPLFGFKVTMKETDLKADKDQIVVSTAGDQIATVKATDAKGNTKTIEWAYMPDTGTTTINLADSKGKAIATYEGEKVVEGGYVVLTQGGFEHLMKVYDVDTLNDKVTLQDVFSGTTYEVSYNDADGTGSKIIDGYEYFFNVTEATKEVAVTWGTGAAAANAGSEVVVYPTLELQNGEKIAFTAPITGVSFSGDIVLPTGTLTVSSVTNSTTSVTVGGLTYSITGTDSDSDGYYDTITSISLAATSQPAILVVEEEANDNSVGYAVVGATAETTGSAYRVTVDGDVTLPSGVSWVTTSDTNVAQALDVYGTLVEKDTSDQGKVTIYYPDDQVSYTVAVGSNPAFGTATVEAEISFPSLAGGVGILDTEAAPFKGTKNFILVGGPAANSLVAELAQAGKTPSFEEWQQKLVGKAILQAIDNPFGGNKVAIVVAGWSADDTRTAALKLATEELSGEAKEITAGEMTDFTYPFPAEEEQTSE